MHCISMVTNTLAIAFCMCVRTKAFITQISYLRIYANLVAVRGYV